MSLVMALMGLSAIWGSRRVFGSWVSPLAVYGGTWGFLLALFFLRMVPYPRLSLEAGVLVLGSYAAFLLGCGSAALAGAISFRRKGFCRNKSRLAFDRCRLRKMLALCAFAASVGAFGTTLEVLQVMSIPTILAGGARAGLLSGEIVVPTIWGVLECFNFALSVLVGLSAGTLGKWPPVALLLVLTSAIHSVIWAGRTFLLEVALLSVASYVLSRQTHSTTNQGTRLADLQLIVGLLIVGTLVTLIWMWRGGLPFAEMLASAYAPSISPVAFHYYYYLTGSPAALDAFIQEYDGGRTCGTSLLYPIVHQFAKLGIDVGNRFQQGSNQAPVEVPVKLNVFSYLRATYMDFGVAGSLLFAYLLGFGGSIGYLLFVRRPTPFRLVLLAYYLVFLGTSYYEYLFYAPSVWLGGVLSLGAAAAVGTNIRNGVVASNYKAFRPAQGEEQLTPFAIRNVLAPLQLAQLRRKR